ncbi:hypothetical protein B7463_g12578, partial [Scytalidium lignicola]
MFNYPRDRILLVEYTKTDYNPTANYAVARQIDGNILAPSGILQIGRRLQECFHSHETCRVKVSFIRPPRFIAVDSDFTTVRLQSLDPTRSDPYAALSYCWGEGQSIRTTLANIATHEKGIVVALLPKTLQDAIYVTRALGIKLLWIDSLCIIQDDLGTLTKEVADMTSYYGNALVTLSAASAKSCSEGFLHQVSDDVRDEIGPFYFQTSMGSEARLKLASFKYEEEPINKRAWTLQEGLLSPRLVSFGSHQIGWSCKVRSYGWQANIRFREKLVQLSRTSPRVPTRKTFDFDGIREPLERDKESEHMYERKFLKGLELWYEVVENYTERILSVQEDRLPAISGIARQFAEIVSLPERLGAPGYLAGLWNNLCLPIQLLWMPKQRAKRCSSYIAPSWSWASIEVPVHAIFPSEAVDFYNVLQTINVKNVEIHRLSDQAPYGALTGGSLTIAGQTFNPDVKTKQNIHLQLDTDNIGDSAISSLRQEDLATLLCLRIIPPLKNYSAKFHGMKLPKGLILLPNQEGSYRRVGLYYQDYTAAEQLNIKCTEQTVTIV